MKPSVNIYSGEWQVSSEPKVLQTILGSCVAVCLHDPIKQIGGMNHILLPGKADMNHYDSAARYGVNAMELLINGMLTLGADREQLVAKIFGGANVIPLRSPHLRMGEKNSIFVLEFLKLEGIRIVNQDMGGKSSRKILFHTDTGEVFLKRMNSRLAKQIAEEQVEKRIQIRQQAGKPGEVVWFPKNDTRR